MERILEEGASFLLFNLTKKIRSLPASSPKSSVTISPETEVNYCGSNPHFVVKNDGSRMKLHAEVEDVELMAHVWNSISQCDFGVCPRLKQLVIGDDCLQCVKGLALVGLGMLTKVEIGSECCRKGEGVLDIRDCAGLAEVRIGKGSCIGWSAFMLKNCPVTKLVIDSGCFSQREGRFEVSDCKELVKMLIGSDCFTEWSECAFKNSELVELSFGDGCFLNLKQFAISGMSKLKKLNVGSWCFTRMKGQFDVWQCPELQEIILGNDCCADWSAFRIMDCSVERVELRAGCFSHCEMIVLESEE